MTTNLNLRIRDCAKFAFVLLSLPCFATSVTLAQHVPASIDESLAQKISDAGGVVRKVSSASQDLKVDFSLSGKQVTGATLRQVAELPRVVELNLRGSKVTSADLAHITNVKSLRRLHVQETDINDSAMQYIGQLGDLQYLNLFGTEVSDKGIAQLASLAKLRSLFVWRTKVTPEGVRVLKQELPSVNVFLGVKLSDAPAKIANTEPPELKWIAAGGAEPQKSVPGSSCTVTFENESQHLVKIYWIGYDGKHVLYGELPAGQNRSQGTYTEATWLITDKEDKPLGHFIASGQISRAVIPKSN